MAGRLQVTQGLVAHRGGRLGEHRPRQRDVRRREIQHAQVAEQPQARVRILLELAGILDGHAVQRGQGAGCRGLRQADEVQAMSADSSPHNSGAAASSCGARAVLVRVWKW